MSIFETRRCGVRVIRRGSAAATIASLAALISLDIHPSTAGHCLMPPDPSPAGRMIVDLTLNDSGRPIASVSFDPPGLFTAGFLHSNLMLFIQQLERAQSKVRHEQAIAAAAARPLHRRSA